MTGTATLEVTGELASGERLLWSGQPRGGIRLTPADAFLIPFSLLWGGFAIFWEYRVFQTNAPFFFRLWGIPFVLMGLYLIVGRFFVDASRRSRTYYGLTDIRILIIAGSRSRSVTSLELGRLAQLGITEHSDRSGTISFGTYIGPMPGWVASSWPGTSKQLPPRFEMIENVRTVYNSIREAQRTYGVTA